MFIKLLKIVTLASRDFAYVKESNVLGFFRKIVEIERKKNG